MINPIPLYFARNENKARSLGLKAYLCKSTLMKVSTASTNGFNRCEFQKWFYVTTSQSIIDTRKAV